MFFSKSLQKFTINGGGKNEQDNKFINVIVLNNSINELIQVFFFLIP